MNYRKINNIVGIAILLIASYVFVSTVEPSTSLWDCGEYIATSNRLEVGHPPGAPTFMMLGRLISAFSAPENAAYMVNVLSALSSALTILFLFWTITHLAKKLLRRDEEDGLSQGSIIAVMGAGAVGALAYMFSDTFWFSAEEGEVYAMSSFFTAISFWSILKWEDNYKKVSSDRWIILIFFLIGIAVGVHLLNLLVIPAAAFVFYFKKYEFSIKGFLITGIASIMLLGILNSVFFPAILSLSDSFERTVNGMGAGFNTGTFLFFLLISIVLGGGMYFFQKRGNRLMHTITLSITVMIIGFSTFAMIVVRSNSNPPLDENNPETIPALMSYFGREQYGDWPLLSGPHWNSPAKANTGEIIGKKYFKAFTFNVKGKAYSFQTEFEAKEFLTEQNLSNVEIKQEYIETGNRFEQIYPPGNDNQYTLFPRMYDTRPEKIQGYMNWSNYEGNRLVRAKEPKMKEGTGFRDLYIPTSAENFRYFKDYQIGWMYFRYFMWNFAGRQNDLQGHNEYYGGDGMVYKGSLTRGNWISGVNFIDKERVGTQNNLPQTMQQFEAYNTYYYLPLILGLIGLIFMIMKAPKDAFSIFLLFFFTGLAIVIYLNQRPYEPRERDYAVAASFYAFAIWIGFSVIAIYKWAMTTDMKQFRNGVLSALGAGVLFYIVETLAGGSHAFSYSVLFMAVIGILMVLIPMFLHRSIKNNKVLASLVTSIALTAPVLMGFQNWDDHDRSDRYFAREIAKNYLNSCDQNAILFCFGDNDTFPLWYAQEVEAIRTDMKVMNYSLLSSDWHYNQLKRKTYKAEAVETLLDEPEFRAGTRDIVVISPSAQSVSAREFIEYMKSGRDQNPRDAQYGYSRVPFNKLYVDVNKQKAVESGLVSQKQSASMVDRIEWTLSGGYITKADLAIIDILAAYNWDRPLYFTSTAIQGGNRGLSRYLQVEGMTAKFVPIINPGHNREKMYSLLMGEQKDLNGDGTIDGYNWGNIEKEEVFCDYYTMRMIRSARMHYMQLAESFVNAAFTLERAPDTTSNNASLVKEYRIKAVNLLDKQYEVFPIKSCKIDELLNYTAMMYYRANDTAKGLDRCKELASYYAENVAYFAEQNSDYIKEMYQEIGDFMTHFYSLNQGTGDESIRLKNFNPESYNKMVQKFQTLIVSDDDFRQLVQSDIYTIGQSRRPGVFPIPFYQDAVPSLLPDADRDGVSDFLDKCPTTPGTIEKDGCP
jgi:MFS family permease